MMNNSFYDYSITAIGEELDDNKIKSALEALGLSEVLIEKLLNFDAYVESLPNGPIENFALRCDDWIRCWGNGGGDLSTEAVLREACKADKSNNPRVLARTLYESIVNYTKTSLDASSMVATIINECLNEE